MSHIAAASKPRLRPANPSFSSGPCAKRPGWSLAALDGALLGRSHRAPEAKARLQEVIERSRAVLGMPADWQLGIVPGPDTGAVEMAMWSMLGRAAVDVLAFESFSAPGRPMPSKQFKPAGRARAARAVRAAAGPRLRSIRRMTWCSPGTARPPACACRTATVIRGERTGS